MSMLKQKIIARAALAALLGCLAQTAAMAVSLGTLTIKSAPGEPLVGEIEIREPDVTVSPLLVRVAPPATYLREGVSWPGQAKDLRLAPADDSSSLKVRILGKDSTAEGFPLLIELNAGGTVSVRQYQLSVVNGKFVVTPLAERTTVKSLARTLPDMQNDAPDAVQSALDKASEKRAPKKFGRFAPRVVAQYVALHGFSAEEPFTVQNDMTLWSIAKLYSPHYMGATMEQILEAFVLANPKAFINGDMSKIVVGATLMPPSLDAVFAIDPLLAYKKLRGENAPVAASVQTLIDAQSLSRDAAKAVAQKQISRREMTSDPEQVAAAGREELIRQQSMQKQAQSDKGGASLSSVDRMADRGDAARSTSDTQTESLSQALGQKEMTPQEASQKADRASTVATDLTTEAQKTPPATKATFDSPLVIDKKNDRVGTILAGLGALLLIGLFFFIRRRKNKEETSEKKPPQTVTLIKDVEPTTSAQLTALTKTVDECVKNGTTAGAMGVGTMAYAQAQVRDDTTDQPWLKAEDDELPPLDPEEAATSVAPGAISAKLDGVSLELVQKDEQPLSQNQQEQEKLEPLEELSDKQKALAGALDAKLNLANSFIGLGAFDEAKELLEEVWRQGTERQRMRAKFLEERINSR